MQTSTQHAANKFSRADKNIKLPAQPMPVVLLRKRNIMRRAKELPEICEKVQTSAMLKSHQYAANQDKKDYLN